MLKVISSANQTAGAQPIQAGDPYHQVWQPRVHMVEKLTGLIIIIDIIFTRVSTEETLQFKKSYISNLS